MSDILNSFKDVAPYINKLTYGDFTVSICDLDRCLLYVPSSKQNHNIKLGDEHIDGSVAFECIRKGERVVRKVGSHVFGFPYIAIGEPIYENNTLVGCVTFTEAVDRHDLVIALIDNLEELMNHMDSIIDMILNNGESLNKIGAGLDDISQISQLALKNIDLELRKIDKSKNAIFMKIEGMKLGLLDSDGFEGIEDYRLDIEGSLGEIDKIIGQLRLSYNDMRYKIDDLVEINKVQEESNKYMEHLLFNISNRRERLKENVNIMEI